MLKRLFLAAAVAAVAGVPDHVQASESRVVGIVSLVADHLTVTGFESTTGSTLNANPTQRIELREDGLERSVLRAALRAVNERRFGRPVPLLFDDGKLYAAQEGMVSDGTARLPDTLVRALQAQKATHLLLITKHRAEARMNAGAQRYGSGRVEGLGFYIDRVTEIRDTQTGQISVGYLAPHAYLRVSLIDLADARVIGSRTVTASSVIRATDKDRGGDPWDLLDNAGKMKAIDEMITREAGAALRELLAS